MNMRKLPKWFLEKSRAVTAKRPKTVINHILKHGHITTEELRTLYGYEHPPRAARDAREEGIALETFRVKDSQGRSIGAYRFAPLSESHRDHAGGRRSFPKEFKEQLVAALGSRCTISQETYEERYLQIDHRVPYEVSGDPKRGKRKAQDYMLLCGSCNRAKSWSCEHCANWIERGAPAVCMSCYWASPESYRHVALRQIRRLDVVWAEHEVRVFDKIRQRADSLKTPMPDYVKEILRRQVGFLP
jgi:hypothetical protein